MNIASVAGLQGVARLGAYAAAKRGVIGFSRRLALKFGEYGVTCNVICPAPTRAGWTISKRGIGKISSRSGMSVDDCNARAAESGAIERMVEPEEVAELALFFASAARDATTGYSVRFAVRFAVQYADSVCADSICGFGLWRFQHALTGGT